MQYIDDHEVQLDQVVTAPLPKIPLDISLRGKRFSFGINLKKKIIKFLFSSLAGYRW